MVLDRDEKRLASSWARPETADLGMSGGKTLGHDQLGRVQLRTCLAQSSAQLRARSECFSGKASRRHHRSHHLPLCGFYAGDGLHEPAYHSLTSKNNNLLYHISTPWYTCRFVPLLQ